VHASLFKSFHFKEFTVRLYEKTVAEMHASRLERRIHGGKPLVEEFPEFGETALFCVTEMHSKKDIDLLVSGIKEVLEI